MALQRSSGHPIDIGLSPTQDIEQDTPDFQPFMNAVTPHKDRWRRMDILVPCSWVPETIAALGGPPPKLERLSLIDTETRSCAREFDLFGGRPPLLNSLTLNGVSIRWDSEVLHNLTIFNISWIHFPSTDAVLRALSHSPQLQKLRIYRCSTGSMATLSSPFVRLPRLVLLEVEHRDEDATQNFLDHIISDVQNAR